MEKDKYNNITLTNKQKQQQEQPTFVRINIPSVRAFISYENYFL